VRSPVRRAPSWFPPHRLVAFWLLSVAPLLAVPVPPVGPRYALLVLHVVTAVLLLRQPLDVGSRPGESRFPLQVREWAPLLVVPMFYWETPLIAAAIHGGAAYDSVVLAWEAWLFGGQPSQTLALRWPWLWLSELLHGAYLSYYLIVMVPPIVLYRAGRRGAFRRVVFTIVLAFLVHQALFIAFPVLGPRYLFPAPAGGLENGILYRLTHHVLESGSSAGTAFPSSHVGISVAITLALFRERMSWAVWVAALTTLLGISTVYGGFHYAIDAVAGIGSGAVAAGVAPGVWRLLRQRRHRHILQEQ
jgi:membrane-associated phospholipid phosphatase